jgi:hypothetical protein
VFETLHGASNSKSFKNSASTGSHLLFLDWTSWYQFILSFPVFAIDVIDIMVLWVCFYSVYYSGFVLLFERNKLPPSSGWLSLFLVCSFQASDQTSELNSVKTWKTTYVLLVMKAGPHRSCVVEPGRIRRKSWLGYVMGLCM